MTQEEFLKQAKEKLDETLKNVKQADVLMSDFYKEFPKEKLDNLEPQETTNTTKKAK